ncbi:MAG: hypothetical protein BV458_10185, partial [Thermoplasmata archaeon M9B2D]
MNQDNKSTKALLLSMVAGILIISNTILANDTQTLYTLTAIGLILGMLVLLAAILLHIKPVNKKVWGIIIIVFSIPSVLTGGGFIIGFILGIIGGALSLSRKPD